MNNSNTTNVRTVLILGATGGFGSALTQHMARSGWQVRALTRREIKPTSDANHMNANHDNHTQAEQRPIQWVVGNLNKPSTLQAAAYGVDLIVHAVNVPYPKWDPLMLNYTNSIIDLARANDAHLMFVGNIYNAGLPADGLISEYTPHSPINEKGQVRATLEDMLRAASDTGVRTTIMRFGDFFGPGLSTNNWFNECTKGLMKNKLTIAGPSDMPHTWAYLPDAVAAMERVASQRIASTESPEFMNLPFAGHVFSFAELQQTIEEHTGVQLKVAQLPWTLFKVLGLIMPVMRDIVSMRYLWNHDIRMNNSALTIFLGSAPEHTDLLEAVCAIVPELRDHRSGDHE